MGAFRAFCGFFVDVIHTDGSVSTFQSPFARNAPPYLHYEAFHVKRDVPVRRVRVMLMAPGGQPAEVEDAGSDSTGHAVEVSLLRVLHVPLFNLTRPRPSSAGRRQRAAKADPRRDYRSALVAQGPRRGALRCGAEGVGVWLPLFVLAAGAVLLAWRVWGAFICRLSRRRALKGKRDS